MYLNKVTLTNFPGGSAEARTTREATILQYIDHVHILARRLQFRVPPCVTFDDLVGAGTIGLIQAVDRFQPSRNLKFGTYAKHRIWGAMLDFLREEDPLSRTERRRIRTAEATGETTGQFLPTTISLEQLPAHELCAAHAQAGCPESSLGDRAVLKQARQCLSARENRVISLLYELDWKNSDVARELRVNESRVSQIKHVALSKLRARLHGQPSGVAA
jgi:RNA polymerase sigma factor for flagellar operon FliA